MMKAVYNTVKAKLGGGFMRKTHVLVYGGISLVYLFALYALYHLLRLAYILFLL